METFDLKISERRILRRVGYKKKWEEANSSLKDIITEERERIFSLLQPGAVFITLEYEETDRHPIFDNAEKVALCICTAGPEVEKDSARLIRENEILRGVVVDAMGSEAVEEIAGHVDRLIAAEARQLGLWPSKRFSPGYKNWDLEGQLFIFEKLPAEKIGVRLNEFLMMVPRKSVSFRMNFYRDKSLSNRK